MREGTGEDKIDWSELLILNEAGLTADYAFATNLIEVGDDQYTLTARLKPQTEPRIIHFVANRNYGGNDSGR